MAAVTSQTSLAAPCPSPFAPSGCLLERMDTSYLSNPLSLSSPPSLTAASPPLSALASQQEVYASLSLPWPPLRKLRLSEGSRLSSTRLASASLRLSPTQPATPGRGNSCMFHALLDQLRHQPGLERTAASHSQLRAKLVQAAFNSVRAGKLSWAGEGGTVEEWRAGMAEEGTMGDQLVLQAAANLFRRDLVIQPVFQDAAHVAEAGVTVVRPSGGEPAPGSSAPMWLQYYSESRFLTPHYQSVLPCPGPNPILAFLRIKRQQEEEVEEERELEEDEDDIFLKLNSLPDPPTTPSQSLRSNSSSTSSTTFSPLYSSSTSSFLSDHMSPTRSISTSSSPSSPFSRPSSSSSNSSSSSSSSTYQFMHLLGHQVQGVGRQTRI